MDSLFIHRQAARLAFCGLFALAPPMPSSAAELVAGSLIKADNLDSVIEDTFAGHRISDLMPESMRGAVRQAGMVIEPRAPAPLAYNQRGVGTLMVQYVGGRLPDVYAYIKAVRRVRRLSGNAWADPVVGTDMLTDETFGLNIDLTWYPEYKITGKRWVLAALHSQSTDARLDAGWVCSIRLPSAWRRGQPAARRWASGRRHPPAPAPPAG